MPVVSMILSIVSEFSLFGFIYMMIIAVLMPLSIAAQSGLGYNLYFIDGETQVPYDHLKGFMKKNNLK